MKKVILVAVVILVAAFGMYQYNPYFFKRLLSFEGFEEEKESFEEEGFEEKETFEEETFTEKEMTALKTLNTANNELANYFSLAIFKEIAIGVFDKDEFYEDLGVPSQSRK